MTSEAFEPEQLLDLQDCDKPEYLSELDDVIKEQIVQENLTKCVDLTKANVGQEGQQEQIVVLAWQHCQQFKPREECATSEEKEEFFCNNRIKVSLSFA